MADNIARLLKDADVRNAKPGDKPYKRKDGGGLFLLVQPNGSKLWRYKFRLHGKEGLLAIGSYPDISLAKARELHRSARTMVAAGENPVHARRAEREQVAQELLRQQAGAFVTVLDGWRAITDPDLSPLSIRQREREIRKYLLPAFKGRTIQSVTRAELAALLKRVEARAPEVARNLRNYLSGIMEHAIGLGLVDANPVPPTRILRRRAQVSHAALDAERLPDFLRTVSQASINPETRIAMQLVILTACRKSEVCGARWDEFDLEAGEWTIPAERMKARREHWVPLSRQAVELLRDLRRLSSGTLLFPNRRDPDRPIAERTLNAVLQRNGYHGETIHGFRSVFSTHFNEAGANPDVIERCLAHAPRDKVRAVYNRHQYQAERRELLQRWADHLEALELKAARVDCYTIAA